MKKILLLALIFISSPVFAAPAHVYAEVSSLEGIDFSTQKIIAEGKPMSTGWWIRACCMQSAHPKGLISPECFEPEINKWINSDLCKKILLIEHQG